MKNIHIIPTDQPSNIGYHFDIDLDGRLDYAPNFGFEEFNIERNFQHRPHFIYITSDEDIKEGVYTWYLDKFLNKPYNSGGAKYGSKQDVIILTTDTKLITDGVQAIDEEFLKWCINNPTGLKWLIDNPTCEFIEVKQSFTSSAMVYGINTNAYEIIIPQEETKTDLEIENYYIGKTLKLKKRLPSKYYETSLKESETIKIDKFIDGKVEGCRVAIGYKYGHEFLLFNTTYVESYMKSNFELIDESPIPQQETNIDKFLKLASDEKSTWVEDLEHYNENKEELDAKFEAELRELTSKHVVMHYREAQEFILNKFLPLISKRFEERWPDTFIKCNTHDKEIFENSNGTMYSYYNAIVNSISKLPETPKYKRSDINRNDYSFVRTMYDDFAAVSVSEIPAWLMEFISIK